MRSFLRPYSCVALRRSAAGARRARTGTDNNVSRRASGTFGARPQSRVHNAGAAGQLALPIYSKMHKLPPNQSISSSDTSYTNLQNTFEEHLANESYFTAPSGYTDLPQNRLVANAEGHAEAVPGYRDLPQNLLEAIAEDHADALSGAHSVHYYVAGPPGPSGPYQASSAALSHMQGMTSTTSEYGRLRCAPRNSTLS